MKKIIVFIVIAGFSFSALAQSETATVSYLKIDRLVVVNEIPFPEKTIMNAIDKNLQLKGYKAKEAKGFTVYKSVKMPEIGNGEYDLYFMAERKSRRNKDNSTLNLMIAKGNDVFWESSKDAALITGAMKYLDSILPIIIAFDLELQITDQEDAVKKAEKKHENLIDDGNNLEKKRKSIEKDIEDNKKDQEKQKDEIEKQKQILETLRVSRKQK